MFWYFLPSWRHACQNRFPAWLTFALGILSWAIFGVLTSTRRSWWYFLWTVGIVLHQCILCSLVFCDWHIAVSCKQKVVLLQCLTLSLFPIFLTHMTAWDRYSQIRESSPFIKSLLGTSGPLLLLHTALSNFWPTMLNREQRGVIKKSDPGGHHYYVGCLGQTRVSLPE